ncbi:MAG: GNAT family N-acetyltransferase, partial [Candidatus Ornithospirochaeta sp.]
YCQEEDGEIVSAVAVTFFQGEDYHSASWAISLNDDEVAVLHLLAVSPERQGAGIGRKTVEDAVEMARKRGMKAVRLDALATNSPALSLYASLGFETRGRENWFAENTGNTDFLLLEKVL